MFEVKCMSIIFPVFAWVILAVACMFVVVGGPVHRPAGSLCIVGT